MIIPCYPWISERRSPWKWEIPGSKAAAKYIAPGNEEDGVAQVIEKLLLDLE